MAIDAGKAANELLHWERCALSPLLLNWPLKFYGGYDLQIIYKAKEQDQEVVNLLGPTGVDGDNGHYNHLLFTKQAEDIGRAIERVSRKGIIIGVGYRITVGGRVIDLIFPLEGPA